MRHNIRMNDDRNEYFVILKLPACECHKHLVRKRARFRTRRVCLVM